MTTATLGIDLIGWVATAVMVASLLFASPVKLRVFQVCGALLWLSYGVLIGSPPVIVANMLICMVAFWTLLKHARSDRILTRITNL